MDLKCGYIEPDLALTSDLKLVAMHVITLDETTDVKDHPEFADRLKNKTVTLDDDVHGSNTYTFEGYFVDEFTLAELKTLRLVQRERYTDYSRTKLYDGLFLIPTLSDIVDLIQKRYEQNGDYHGIYIELKHARHYAEKNIDIGQILLDSLSYLGFDLHGESVDNDMSSKLLPLVIQCFDNLTLKNLRKKTEIPLVQLIKPHDKGADLKKIDWNDVKQYSNGVGIDKNSLTALSLENARSYVKSVQESSMVLHTYTSRRDFDESMAKHFDSSFYAESIYLLCCLGVDGIFTEQPDLTREYMRELSLRNQNDKKANACPINCEDYQPSQLESFNSTSPIIVERVGESKRLSNE
jgi:glycerophosphoryl diester phosphodiesterase